MSNIIPPLLSDTPPPPPDIDDHEDDEFGDFTGANSLSYDCDDDFSPPASPLKLPIDLQTPETFNPVEPNHKSQIFDINSNSKEDVIFSKPIDKEKDFHDKRKDECRGSIIDSSAPPGSIENDVLETQGLKISIAGDTASNEDAAKLYEEENNETNCDNIPNFNQNEISPIDSQNVQETVLDNNQVDSCVEIITVENNSPDSTCELNFCNSGFSEEDKSKQFSLFGNKFSIPEASASPAFDKSKLSDIQSDKQVDHEDLVADNKSAFDDDYGCPNTIESNSQSAELEFNDFQNSAPESANMNADDDFDDFGDFASISSSSAKVITISAIEVQATNVDMNKDGFGEFATNWDPEPDDFGAFAEIQPKNEPPVDDNDDFGDFTEFATPSIPVDTSSNPKTESKFLLLNEKEAFQKCTEIITEMFPPLGQKFEDYMSRELVVDDKIFDQIKNVTDTHALSYQWAKSSSQKMLLKSLNIDTRNILYGPGWNPSMPRFAANLSFTPLQPMRTEILSPIPAKKTSSSHSKQSSAPALDGIGAMDVPGAINPLQNKEVSEIADTPTKATQEPNKIFGLTPTVLHSSNPLTEPSVIKSKLKSSVNTDDFDDFVSYSNPPEHPIGHSVLLRETHISNKEPNKIEETDIVNWLEPTIVTPELTRKERTFDPEEMDELVVASVDPGCKALTLTVKPVEVLEPLPIKQSNHVKKSSLDLDFLEDFTKLDKKSVEEGTNSHIGTEDDFGDFTYSLPNQTSKNTDIPIKSCITTMKPLTSSAILEPLKPSIPPSRTSGAISWPDPGVTDDEISRFEALGFARSQNKSAIESEKSKTEPHKKTDQHKSRKGSIEVAKHNLDDEEWSDFVSVQNQSPVHKLKQEKERSSTPDLPLSVLNLGSVQPAKQPIPVITPNGLVQTKLSSNMTLNFPNLLQPTNRVYPQPQVQNTPVFQPSLISNQYASQSFNNYNNYGGYKAPVANAEEDEWSDFVSHQSVAKSQVKPPHQTNQFTNWMNVSPNVSSINGSSAPGAHKQSNKVVSSANINGTTSAPVPDLSFLTPRNRTSQRK